MTKSAPNAKFLRGAGAREPSGRGERIRPETSTGKSNAIGRKLATKSTPVKSKSPVIRLPAKVKAVVARNNLSSYVDAVASRKKPLEITAHNVVVAVLAPIGAVPADQIKADYTVDEFKRSKKPFGTTIYFGPYALRKGDRRVAVIYAPRRLAPQLDSETAAIEEETADLARRMISVMERIQKINRDIDKAKQDLIKLKEMRDQAIERTKHYIRVLRSSGHDGAEEAKELEAELGRLERLAARRNVNGDGNYAP